MIKAKDDRTLAKMFDLSLEEILEAQLNLMLNENPINFLDIVNFFSSADRKLALSSDIDCGTGFSVSQIISFWNLVDDASNIPIEKREPVKLLISTDGGDLDESFIIYDAIKLSKTPVYTIGIGNVYSGGFLCYLAGHKKLAMPHASFLFHEGSAAYGSDASRFRDFAEHYKVRLEQMKNLVMSETNIDEDTYREFSKSDKWLTVEEAIEYGICDEIMTKLV